MGSPGRTSFDRRTLLLAGAGIGATLGAGPATAAPAPSGLGVSAAELGGVRPDSSEDQSAALQRAIDIAAERRLPLFLAPGVYRVTGVTLRPQARLVGITGATRLVPAAAGAILIGERCDGLGLHGLVLDGLDRPLPRGRGLLTLEAGRDLDIAHCTVSNSGAHGIHLEGVSGSVSRCTLSDCAKTGLFSRDAAGLRIVDNLVARNANNGIQVWRSQVGEDGTLVTGNQVQDIAARDGGSGQNGNGINLFRANNVLVANNRIRNCAFSAVRGNSASDLQIVANNCSRLGEVALYVEFASEGAVVANNIVDGASIGLSMTNFNEGGRLGVAQGNLLRNLQLPPDPGNDPDSGWGMGIYVEADVAVTGNVVENAAKYGLSLGWGPYLRDVTASGNIIRNAPVGIAVSVTPGAGTAVIKDNLIVGAQRGAVIGFDRKRPVTGDLTRETASRYAQLAVAGNVAR